MFTGIIEEIGTVKEVTPQGSGMRLQIWAQKVFEDLSIDQSISVNGVCLTVIEKGSNFFVADAVEETLEKSTLKYLKRNDRANLERALRLQDRLGGHLVQGHVDGVGAISHIVRQTFRSTWTIEIPVDLEPYLIPKGSIAIDGVSLTIAQKNKNIITMAIIPHTMKQTIFQYHQNGDRVNIEVDFFARYIEQFLNRAGETKITSEWLKQRGY